MMVDLADLYASLGGEVTAEEIRRKGDFTKTVVVSTNNMKSVFYQLITNIQANIQKMGDLNLITLDCNTPGSSELIADTLDELAGLGDEVVLENLCNQLDVVCTF